MEKHIGTAVEGTYPKSKEELNEFFADDTPDNIVEALFAEVTIKFTLNDAKDIGLVHEKIMRLLEVLNVTAYPIIIKTNTMMQKDTSNDYNSEEEDDDGLSEEE